MITFNDLVEQTHKRLTAKASRNSISIEMVQHTLENAGLADLLVSKSDAKLPKRLLVRRVWFKGIKWPGQKTSKEFTYQRDLMSGINVWIGNNSTGKSTILKAIFGALTGTDPGFKRDVQTWLRHVAVEFEIIGDGLYTIHYTPSESASETSGQICMGTLAMLQTGDNEFNLLERFTGAPAMRQAVSRFFSNKLDFIPLQWSNWKPNSFDTQQQTISWETYAQVLMMGADEYVDFLFPRLDLSRHHQKTLGLYFGFDHIEAVSQAQITREEAKAEYAFQKRRISENAIGVREQIADIEQELGQIERKLQQIENEQTVLVDPVYVHQVGDRVAQLTLGVVDLTNGLRELEREKGQAQNDLERAERAVLEMREAIAFTLFLSDLEVERCPHCENLIPNMQPEDELRSGHCRVCNSELRPSTPADQRSDLLHLAERNGTALKKDLRNLNTRLKQTQVQLDQAQQDLEQNKAEFMDLSRQAREGFTAELRQLLNRRGYLEGQLAQLRQQTTESQARRLKEIRDRHEILQAAHLQLQERIMKRYEAVLDQFGARMTELARALGVLHLDEVFFDKDFNLFIRQSGSHSSQRFADMGPAEKLKLKLALQLTLLTMRSRLQTGRHPGVLLIDAPGSAEMDALHFEALLSGLAEIKGQYEDQVQILIASAKEQLAEVCDDTHLEQRRSDEFFF